MNTERPIAAQEQPNKSPTRPKIKGKKESQKSLKNDEPEQFEAPEGEQNVIAVEEPSADEKKPENGVIEEKDTPEEVTAEIQD